jgi:ElaA protein
LDQLTWIVKTFGEFSGAEMHEMLMVRSQVFVVEQRCFYQDPDAIDEIASHLLGYQQGRLVAYSRYWHEKEWVRLGRVLTTLDQRGRGLGRCVIKESLARLGEHPVLIFAQSHLKALYEDYGFAAVGDEFLEDGIPHIRMERA